MHRKTGAVHAECAVLGILGSVLANLDRRGEAEALFIEGIRLAEALGQRRLLCAMHNNLSNILFVRRCCEGCPLF